MKIWFFMLLVFLVACSAQGPDPATAHSTRTQEIKEQPRSPIRYNGIYREDVGGLIYMIRFFPEGNAVLINGSEQVADSLPQMLVPNAAGNPDMGWYNVPFRFERDSLFIVTKPPRGDIDYRGNFTDDSTLRFERYSHINGDRRIKTYIFQQDK